MKNNDDLIKEFNYGTYQNDLTIDISKNSVKIHLSLLIKTLQSVITDDTGYTRSDILKLICDLEIQRSALNT